jgi:hypothetical protein
MDHYGAHLIATLRRQEFTADASASRLAAAFRRHRADSTRGTRNTASTEIDQFAGLAVAR